MAKEQKMKREDLAFSRTRVFSSRLDTGVYDRLVDYCNRKDATMWKFLTMIVQAALDKEGK